MKSTVLILAAMVILNSACGTPSQNCQIRIRKSSAEFLPKIENKAGDQILFTIEFEGANCTPSGVDRQSKEVFEKYAREHDYNNLDILERFPDKVAAYRYIVLFKPSKH